MAGDVLGRGGLAGLTTPRGPAASRPAAPPPVGRSITDTGTHSLTPCLAVPLHASARWQRWQRPLVPQRPSCWRASARAFPLAVGVWRGCLAVPWPCPGCPARAAATPLRRQWHSLPLLGGPRLWPCSGVACDPWRRSLVLLRGAWVSDPAWPSLGWARFPEETNYLDIDICRARTIRTPTYS